MEREIILALAGGLAGVMIVLLQEAYATSQVHFVMNATYGTCMIVDKYNNTYSAENLADHGNVAVLNEAKQYWRGFWSCCIHYCLT